MCKIGQNDRCSKTGCEFSKAFGTHCHGEKIKTGYAYYSELYKAYLWKDEYPKDIHKQDLLAPKKKKRNKAARKSQSEKNKTRRISIWKRSNGICYICGESVAFEVFTIEHVIPLSKGGGNSLQNCRAAHYDCNQKKADKILEEFLALENSK